MSKENEIKYVDCSPRLKPEQYLEILDMNMQCLKKEFGPGFTKVKKIGSTFSDDELRKAVGSRYAFIKQWYEMLEADLYILDHICQVKGYDRHNLPGVITSVTVTLNRRKREIHLLIRGKPLQAIPLDELQAEVARLYEGNKHIPVDKDIAELKKQLKYYLRGQGYETLDIEEEKGVYIP